MRSRLSGSRGFALIAVLWTVGLLALLATAVISRGLAGSAQARNERVLAQGELAARSAISLLIAERLDPAAQPANLIGPQRQQQVRWQDWTVDLWMEDEAAKLDLNRAPPELIEAGLRAAGVPEADIVRLRARPTRPLVSVEELGGWTSLDGVRLGALASLFTVFGDGRVSDQTADPLVRRLLESRASEQVLLVRPENELPTVPGVSALDTYTVIAVARRGDILIGRRAIIRLTAGFETPVEWLNWAGFPNLVPGGPQAGARSARQSRAANP
jgi:type II secretory pathway pseudopilin PulG